LSGHRTPSHSTQSNTGIGNAMFRTGMGGGGFKRESKIAVLDMNEVVEAEQNRLRQTALSSSTAPIKSGKGITSEPDNIENSEDFKLDYIKEPEDSNPDQIKETMKLRSGSTKEIENPQIEEMSDLILTKNEEKKDGNYFNIGTLLFYFIFSTLS